MLLGQSLKLIKEKDYERKGKAMGLFHKLRRKKSIGPPWLYSEKEWDTIENHIKKYFGDYENVFHEIFSPDIHLDIICIEPTKERNHYTLVTMGAGAYRMNVPEGASIPSRAEYLITLPPDWVIDSQREDEHGWPLRFLKKVARIPVNADTYLAYGHTISEDEDNSPFASNTKLCSIALAYPKQFAPESSLATLPDGSELVFYQMVPLYADELQFKRQCKGEMEEFETYLGSVLSTPLDIHRESVV